MGIHSVFLKKYVDHKGWAYSELFGNCPPIHIDEVKIAPYTFHYSQTV